MDSNATRFAITLVATMTDAVIYADAQGIIRFWNSGAERVFSFAQAEAVGTIARHTPNEWSGLPRSCAT